MESCKICGIEKNLNNFYVRKDGYFSSYCKKCERIKTKEWRNKNKEQHYKKVKEWHTANKDKVRECQKKSIRQPASRFKWSERIAGGRNIEWLLTKDQYIQLIQFPCYYCNGFFGKSECGVGLDRLDNSKGYVIDNVSSCCNTCNALKMDKFTVEETKAAISLIIKMRTKQ